MSIRTRKFIGMIILIIALTIYVLVAMRFATAYNRGNIFLEIGLYFILGVAWIFPARYLLAWMQKE